jgi:predicted 3-demethylubiquinone-9 3-methyltransferase (glyoxalase superfamily)
MGIVTSQKIMPFLWFKGQAEAAIQFYTNLFPKSNIEYINHWAAGGPHPTTYVMNAGFSLCGLQLYAMDGQHDFEFTEAQSLFVHCKDQVEVDKYWNALREGGKELQCGWVKDRFGMCWQIIPMQLIRMLNASDKKKSQQAMSAMLQMKKIDILALEEAFNL